MTLQLAAGAAFLVWFFLYTRARERAGKEPLLPTRLFKNHTSNLGLITQNVQWLLLMGVSFTVAVFLQEVRGYNAIETGVIFTAAPVGVLVSSLAAERLAKRRPQKALIIAGFVVTMAGIGLLLALVGASSRVIAFGPGLQLIGLGLGVMLTPSVNLVQSSFAEDLQAEISGLSRSVSNLGFVLRHRDRGHDPGLRPHLGNHLLRPGNDRPGRACPGLAAAIGLPASRGPDRAGSALAATPAPGTATEHG
jgi:Na+/melibiose symporter-like transporter